MRSLLQCIDNRSEKTNEKESATTEPTTTTKRIHTNTRSNNAHKICTSKKSLREEIHRMLNAAWHYNTKRIFIHTHAHAHI